LKLKIGIKVQIDVFEEQISEDGKKLLELYGGIEGLLQYVKENISGVEIAQVKKDTDPQVLRKAVALCESYGLFVTIHGVLYPDQTPEAFFAPYSALDLKKEALLNITVHPLKTAHETEMQLRSIVAYIERMGYNVRITLENQRNKNEDTAFAGCRGVQEIVQKINSPHLFVCFDFGHQMANIKKESMPEDLFDKAFLSLVRHTHIHSCYAGTTHFPLDVGETALDKNILGLLDCGYDQIYLLELVPRRYADTFPVKDSYDNSISVLKTAILQAEKKRQEIARYENAADSIEEAAAFLRNPKDGMVAIGPSGYILKLGETKIAVDPVLNVLPYKAEDKERILELLNLCDAVVVTHGHEDHFDEAVLDRLKADIQIYVPDFMDYQKSSAVSVTKGETACLNGVRLAFFESAHSLGERMVLEYGFSVEYNNKTYVFPADVRDYKKETNRVSPCDVLVAHLWLGRQNALKLYHHPCTDDFCEFVQSFHAENVYISHLYDVHRKTDDMWTEIHYDLIKDRIQNARMIKMGDVVYF